MSGLVSLVILVLDILAIVDAVRSSLSSGKKALWIILILILPVIGLILYYLVGKKK